MDEIRDYQKLLKDYQDLLKDYEEEKVLKLQEQLRFEQEGKLVEAHNCKKRINELDVYIKRYEPFVYDKNNILSLCKILLSQDFYDQKKKLLENSQQNIGHFVLLQGTKSCGLHYFVLHKHQYHTTDTTPALIKTIKADTVIVDDRGNFSHAAWQEIAWTLGIEFDEHFEIPTHIKTHLKEKPIVVIFYHIEMWGSDFFEKIKSVMRFWKEPQKKDNTFFCYFIYENEKNALIFDDELIVMPPVGQLEEKDVELFWLNYKDFFYGCEADIQSLLSGKKKLSEVIDVFLEHSSCRSELRNYFSSLDFS